MLATLSQKGSHVVSNEVQLHKMGPDTCDIDDYGSQAIIGLPVMLGHKDVQPLSRLLSIRNTPDHTGGQEIEKEHL